MVELATSSPRVDELKMGVEVWVLGVEVIIIGGIYTGGAIIFLAEN